MRPGTTFAAVLGFVLATCPAAEGRAFCRATTCPFTPLCTPQDGATCGLPLAWKRPCVGISVHKDASAGISYDVAHEMVQRAFLTWQAAGCGDGKAPGIHVEDLGPVDCALAEYNTKGGNANVVVFRDESWPHPSYQLALTTVSYEVSTGEIYDADIEVNTADYAFTTADDHVGHDLLALLTHEAGHFFGLDHSHTFGATMASEDDYGSIAKRSLDSDDQAAICSTYPPRDIDAEACDPAPRHGYAPACFPDQDQAEAGCSIAEGARARRASPALLALLALLVLMRRRWRLRGLHYLWQTRASRSGLSW